MFLTDLVIFIVFGIVFNMVVALISAILAAVSGYLLYRENCRRDRYPTEDVSEHVKTSSSTCLSLTQYHRIILGFSINYCICVYRSANIFIFCQILYLL